MAGNGILIVGFAKRLRDEGHVVREAIPGASAERPREAGSPEHRGATTDPLPERRCKMPRGRRILAP